MKITHGAVVSVFMVIAGMAFVVTVSGCGTKPAQVSEEVPAPTQPLIKATVAQKAAWEERWEKTLKAAKDEGSVRVYTSIQPEVRARMAKAFKEKFEIDLEYVTARPPEITQRVLAERRAGLYLADVFFGGGTLQVTLLKPNGLLTPLEPALFLPEVIDPNMWRTGKIPFYDRESTSAAFLAALSGFILRNTELVRPDEIKSYRDLLKPGWKGRMVLQDPNLGGTALWWITLLSDTIWGAEETKSFLTELKKQDVPVINDVRLQAEWVARGKHPVGLAPSSDAVFELMRAGAPMAFVKAIEGSMITPGTGAVSLANQPAHPNASVIFVNWLLGKEGQTVVSRAIGRPSLRLDVTQEGFDPNLLPDPGEKPHVEDEKFILATPKALAMFNEIFRP